MTDSKTFDAISPDDSVYRPFLLSPIPGAERGKDGTLAVDEGDWVRDLELDGVKQMARSLPDGRRVKILVLYGSLRERYKAYRLLLLYFRSLADRPPPPPITSASASHTHRSFSRLMAYEASRILHLIGCEVKIYDPLGLPIKDDTLHDHPKVRELRQLSEWSDGQFWCSPEQHGNVTAVFKNQSE